MNAAPAEPLRSRYVLQVRIAAVIAAVVLGLVAQRLLSTYLWQIQELAETNVLQARAALALVLEIASVVVFGLTGSVGVGILFSSRRSLALEQFPVSDLWSFGSRRRPVTGPRARRLAQLGIALAVLLILASCAGGALTWYIAAVLRACRAGVITA